MRWGEVFRARVSRDGPERPPAVRKGRAVAALGIVLIAAVAVPSAQRRRTDNSIEGIPVGTNRILQEPEAYYGKRVTVSAGIERILSGTMFVMDQRKTAGPTNVAPAGHPLLVVAPYLKTALDPKSYLVVRGQLVQFDREALSAVEPGYGLDVPPEIVAQYLGKPVLIALSIRDHGFNELAAKPLPPPTPEEVSMSAVMKTIGALFSQLEGAVDGKQPDVVTQQAAKLQPEFTAAEQIFGAVKRSAAAEMAQTARSHAASIERAVTASDWAAASDAVRALNQQCQGCHSSQRQAQEDGTYRFTMP